MKKLTRNYLRLLATLDPNSAPCLYENLGYRFPKDFGVIEIASLDGMKLRHILEKALSARSIKISTVIRPHHEQVMSLTPNGDALCHTLEQQGVLVTLAKREDK